MARSPLLPALLFGGVLLLGRTFVGSRKPTVSKLPRRAEEEDYVAASGDRLKLKALVADFHRLFRPFQGGFRPFPAPV